MLRRLLSGWIVSMAITAAMVANFGWWVRHHVLDSRAFAADVTNVIDRSSVQSILSDRITEGITARLPAEVKTSANVDHLHQAVDRLVADPDFEPVFTQAIQQAHAAVFEGSGDDADVVLDLETARPLLERMVRDTAPEVQPFIPQAGALNRITVINAGDVPSLARPANWFRDAVYPMIGVAVALLALGFVVAKRRLGLLVWAGMWLAGICLLQFGALALARHEATGRASDSAGEAAVGSVWDILFDAYRRQLLIVALGGAGLAVVAVAVSVVLKSLAKDAAGVLRGQPGQTGSGAATRASSSPRSASAGQGGLVGLGGPVPSPSRPSVPPMQPTLGPLPVPTVPPTGSTVATGAIPYSAVAGVSPGSDPWTRDAADATVSMRSPFAPPIQDTESTGPIVGADAVVPPEFEAIPVDDEGNEETPERRMFPSGFGVSAPPSGGIIGVDELLRSRPPPNEPPTNEDQP